MAHFEFNNFAVKMYSWTFKYCNAIWKRIWGKVVDYNGFFCICSFFQNAKSERIIINKTGLCLLPELSQTH